MRAHRGLLLAAGLFGSLMARPSAAEDLKLSLPLACAGGVGCTVRSSLDTDPGSGAKDYRCGGQTYQGHNGVDIRIQDMAAQKRGVMVLAAAAGTVLRVRNTAPDVSIRAAGAPSVVGQECGNGLVISHGGGWETQYCHMAQASLVVRVGQAVKRGDALGRVGLSGMTEFPHLTFDRPAGWKSRRSVWPRICLREAVAPSPRATSGMRRLNAPWTIAQGPSSMQASPALK